MANKPEQTKTAPPLKWLTGSGRRRCGNRAERSDDLAICCLPSSASRKRGGPRGDLMVDI